MQDGKPMWALAQINVAALPFRPGRLEGIELITVFIDSQRLPDDEPNGTHWCLRAYPKSEGLALLPQVATGSTIKALPMRAALVDADYPCWEDLPCACSEEIHDKYFDLFSNTRGFKLGGWPTLIQSEIYWAPWNKHPISPEYAFQIDSTEKGNWMWGDSGVGYFGRGTAKGREDEWAFSWQCY
jgi:hypothetical protein